MRKQAWEVGKSGHALGHGSSRRGGRPAPPRAPNPRGRCSLEVRGLRCLPAWMYAGATCTLTVLVPLSQGHGCTPPAHMEGLVLENTLLSAHTPLTLSLTHTYPAPGS